MGYNNVGVAEGEGKGDAKSLSVMEVGRSIV